MNNFKRKYFVYINKNVQVGVLKIPAVRDYFKIERAVKHSADALPIKKKGFVAGFKDCKFIDLIVFFFNYFPFPLAWTNMKITRELAERERIDEIQFQRAGKGPLVKTFKYDPTKMPMPTVRSSTNVTRKKPQF